MTNNPAIHRRASGDIDIAVPHDGPDPAGDVPGPGLAGETSVLAGPGGVATGAAAVPEAA